MENTEAPAVFFLCTGPTGAAKAGQKSFVPARRAQRNNQERTPVKFITRVPLTSVSESGTTTSHHFPLFHC
jgi:hypothetical protein